jgi:hypothetical protein
VSTKQRRKRFGQRPSKVEANRSSLRRAVEWVVNEGMFAHLRLHGNVKWTAAALVRLAILWVWSGESSLVAAAEEAIAQVKAFWGTAPVASYQALTGALKSYTAQLLPVLWRRLQGLAEGCHQASWRVGLWLVLGMDGSRLNVPRTEKNELRFCRLRKKRGKKKRRGKKRTRHAQPRRQAKKKSHYDPQPVGPQLWLTLLWHIGSRLPWCWMLGPSYASERAHVLELLQQQTFPENTLFCGDAGFVGYDFWQAIAQGGHHFLVRVGSNVRLLKRLGYVRERAGIVYCWPQEAMRKNRPPLVLRLLHFRDGRGDVYLVTNVLSESALSEAQTSEIYRRRWGIELQFRSFKQTYVRSKLRSRSPDCAEIECHWSLLGLWMVQLLAYKEQTTAGEPPPQTSIATVLRIVRAIMYNLDLSDGSLSQQLRNATTDTYQRHSKKKSRNYPRRKEEPSAGPPQILVATSAQRQKLRQLEKASRAA